MIPQSHSTPRIDMKASGPCAEPRRSQSDDGVIRLTTVLGDLGAWLEETERHRSAVAQAPKIVG
jgi:hypothetical protein